MTKIKYVWVSWTESHNKTFQIFSLSHFRTWCTVSKWWKILFLIIIYYFFKISFCRWAHSRFLYCDISGRNVNHKSFLKKISFLFWRMRFGQLHRVQYLLCIIKIKVAYFYFTRAVKPEKGDVALNCGNGKNKLTVLNLIEELNGSECYRRFRYKF